MLDLDWGQTHIETFVKLNELANKHDCLIAVYVHNEALPYAEDISTDFRISAESRKFLEGADVRNALSTTSSICLELYDRKSKKTNQFVYVSHELGGKIESDVWDTASDEVKEELQSDFDSRFFSLRDTHTEINGFDGVEKQLGCYREGMVLKYFGDMVCDKLKEPRIVAVY